MAFQGYRHKSDKTVGENEASPTKVAGHPEMTYHDGTSNNMLAPVREASITETARSTSWGRSMGDAGDNPGKQGYGGPSSVNPGERPGAATVAADAPVDAVKMRSSLAAQKARSVPTIGKPALRISLRSRPTRPPRGCVRATTRAAPFRRRSGHPSSTILRLAAQPCCASVKASDALHRPQRGREYWVETPWGTTVSERTKSLQQAEAWCAGLNRTAEAHDERKSR